MYGKLFDSMYDGTLAGHWQAIVTLQQLVILANADGVVDMTVEAIARRTTIPERIISAGIAFLLLPDQYSRTPGEDGKRIVPLDDHRPWGWRLVNHLKYRGLRDQSQKREADRLRIANKRNQNKDVAIESQKSQMSPMQYADADAVKKDIVGLKPDAMLVLEFLNAKTGRAYQAVPANVKLISARLREGATVDDCKAVIAKKCREWSGRPEMEEYLRPKTLFNATNFAQYRGELA